MVCVSHPLVFLFDFSAAVLSMAFVALAIARSMSYFIRPSDRCQTVSKTHRRHFCRALKALIRRPAISSRVIIRVMARVKLPGLLGGRYIFCVLHPLVSLYLSFLLQSGRDVWCTGHSWQNLNLVTKIAGSLRCSPSSLISSFQDCDSEVCDIFQSGCTDYGTMTLGSLKDTRECW